MREKAAGRILFVEGNKDGTVGGSQHVLLEVLKHLDRARFDPIVVFYQNHAMIPEFRMLAHVHILDTDGFRLANRFPEFHRAISRLAPLRLLATLLQKAYNLAAHTAPGLLRIVRMIVRERVDLVCLNNAPMMTEWLIACRLTGRPCASYFRATPAALPPLLTWLVGRYDAVLSISQAVTDNARRLGADVSRFTLVHDGIDSKAVRAKVSRDRAVIRKEFLGDASRPLVAVVNNLKHWKGQHVAVEAMSLLHERQRDVLCLLIGDVSEADRSYADELHADIRARGLERNVVFTGRRTDVPDLLSSLDIVLHTSLHGEGFPRIILEAMILGCPIVASSAGPNVEMIEDGISGLLFAPGDAAALAAQMERLLSDPGLRHSVGIEARTRAETLFNIDINMRKTEATFSRLLQDRR